MDIGCKETLVKGWQCNNCGQIYIDHYMASACCKQYYCEMCGCKTIKYRTMCDSCKEQRNYDRARKMTYAEYTEQYPDNMICIDDDFYYDLDDLMDELLENEIKMPNYCWGTKKINIEIDAEEIFGDLENDYLDIYFSKESFNELKKFVDQWNKKHRQYYFRKSYDIAILLDAEEE